MATPELTLPASQPPVSTGIAGLDTLLQGGFTPNRMYLVEGRPGTGKTTIAMQFLLEGRERGEDGLYVALSETTNELRAVGASHGWTLDGIELFQLPTPHNAAVEEQYTLYHPAEVELGDTVRALLAIVDRLRPARIVLDSLSELKLLARDPLRFRRQILALKTYFAGMDTHGAAAGRSGRRRGLAAAEPLPRRPAAGAAAVRVRPGAPAAAHRQVPRRRGHRGLPRLHHQPRRHRGVPADRAARAERRVAASRWRAGSPRWTGCSAAVSPGARRRCSSARRARASRRSPRSTCAARPRARLDLPVRRAHAHLPAPLRCAGHAAVGADRAAGGSRPRRSSPASSRPASSATGCGATSTSSAPAWS